MGAAVVGLLLGLFLGYNLGLDVGSRREKAKSPQDAAPKPGPFDEVKQVLPGFIVFTAVVVILIATHRE